MQQSIRNDNPKSILQRCPVALRQQAITWTKFCQIQQLIYRFMAQLRSLSQLQTGNTVILCYANFPMQDI